MEYERAFEDSIKPEFKYEYQFDTLAVIAVSTNMGNVRKDVVMGLSQALGSKRTVYTTRSWLRGGKDEGSKWSFINPIPDVRSMGMYKDAQKLNFHTVPFADVRWEPYWEVIR